MPLVVWFSKLRPDADSEAYEAWVREVDYAFAEQLEVIRSYRVHKVLGPYADESTIDWNYLEIVDVVDVEQYRQAIDSYPNLEKFLDQFNSFVEASTGVICSLIDV
jgi:hypothetical protein